MQNHMAEFMQKYKILKRYSCTCTVRSICNLVKIIFSRLKGNHLTVNQEKEEEVEKVNRNVKVEERK